MNRLYFKKAWQLLKQTPLFSSISILGTGLAIAMANKGFRLWEV